MMIQGTHVPFIVEVCLVPRSGKYPCSVAISAGDVTVISSFLVNPAKFSRRNNCAEVNVCVPAATAGGGADDWQPAKRNSAIAVIANIADRARHVLFITVIITGRDCRRLDSLFARRILPDVPPPAQPKVR